MKYSDYDISYPYFIAQRALNVWFWDPEMTQEAKKNVKYSVWNSVHDAKLGILLPFSQNLFIVRRRFF